MPPTKCLLKIRRCDELIEPQVARPILCPIGLDNRAQNDAQFGQAIRSGKFTQSWKYAVAACAVGHAHFTIFGMGETLHAYRANLKN